MLALLVAYLWRASAAPATRLADGSVLLRWPPAVGWWLRGLAVLAALAAVGLIVVGTMAEEPVAAAVGVVVAFGGFVAARQTRSAVLLQQREVLVRGAFGSPRLLRWEDLVDLQFRRRNATWVLVGRDGRKLTFSAILAGGVEFPSIVRARATPGRWRRWQAAVDLYREALRHHQVPGRRRRTAAGGTDDAGDAGADA